MSSDAWMRTNIKVTIAHAGLSARYAPPYVTIVAHAHAAHSQTQSRPQSRPLAQEKLELDDACIVIGVILLERMIRARPDAAQRAARVPVHLGVGAA